MMDPESHFDLVEGIMNSVRTCEVIQKIGPRWEKSREKWTFANFRAEFRFHAGHTFDVYEGFKRDRVGAPISRKFSCYFGDGGRELFQFDTHGMYGEDCHLELNGVRLFAGNPDLRGFSPADMDFPTAFGIAHRFLDGERFPWERE
jgi:hypothetical protein